MIAYFSMEVALASDVPTYAGGLGVLAGDTLRAAADLGRPVVAVSLVHRSGYFRQGLDAGGDQTESPSPWSPAARLEPVDAALSIDLEGRAVGLRAWRWPVEGAGGAVVPVYLLDADLPENDPADRATTDRLYAADGLERLRQEAVLGLGGVRLLEALGLDVDTYHLNEGHSALLALALLEARLADAGRDRPTPEDVAAVRRRCVFTTHTPVPAGHDRFPAALLGRVLGERAVLLLEDAGALDGDVLDMTGLALAFARAVNAVSLRHAEVSRAMFPDHPVAAITNGVHAGTWVAPAFRALYDRRVPGWERANATLRQAIGFPLDEVRAAHAEAKAELLAAVAERSDAALDPAALTIGFARRATAYKRAGLLFSDPDRLDRIAADAGPLQIVLAGKAHPLDAEGKAMIRGVHAAATALSRVPVVWLEEYDMALAALLCAGVDVWLNTPLRPLEASGTSGMKAALNGVPSLSVLDGWWVEGHVEGVTGWAIGGPGAAADPGADAEALYRALEETVLPLFHGAPDDWAAVQRATIALNGSHFTTERMVEQYARQIWAVPEAGRAPARAPALSGARPSG